MVRQPLETNSWRSKWLVFKTWNKLHRVSEIIWEIECYKDPTKPEECQFGDCVRNKRCVGADDQIRGEGITICGRKGSLMMPGIFSRIGLPRCSRCCDILGIPRGEGAPFNQGIDK